MEEQEFDSFEEISEEDFEKEINTKSIQIKPKQYPLYIDRGSKQQVKQFKEAIQQYVLAEDTDSEDLLTLYVHLGRLGQVAEDLKDDKSIRSKMLSAFTKLKDPTENSIQIQGADLSSGSTSTYYYENCNHPILKFLGKANQTDSGWLGDIARMTAVIQNELKAIPEASFEAYEENGEVKHKQVGGKKDILVNEDFIRPLKFVAGRLMDFILNLEDEKGEEIYTVNRAESSKTDFLKISRK